MIDLDEQEVKEARPKGAPTLVDEALREYYILDELRQSGAKNINFVITCFVVDSNLWIVTPFCSGGSLQTLVSI